MFSRGVIKDMATSAIMALKNNLAYFCTSSPFDLLFVNTDIRIVTAT